MGKNKEKGKPDEEEITPNGDEEGTKPIDPPTGTPPG